MSSHDLFHGGIFGIFLGFLTGVIWLLLALKGFFTKLFVLLGLGTVLGKILTILIALIGFLAILIFGFFIFKKAWRNCK